jgi:Zn-dependent M28 family amino/carboxypeptidase
MMKKVWLLGTVLLVACGTEAPPADPDAFVAGDSARIMADLELLSHDSLQGRRTGEPGNLMARDFILAAFQEAGLQEPPSGFVQPFEFTGRRDTTQVVQGANVVGFVPGTDPSLGAFVLTAHFDHLGVREGEVFNGADDNATGTVGIISLARYIVKNPLRHTAVFAAVDAEEMGLRGARAFVTAGWPEEIVQNVNLDMIGRSDSLLFAVGTAHYPHLKPILEGVTVRPPVRIAFGHDVEGVEGVQDWTGSSDHGPFHDQGIPFVYFGVEDHPDYHHPTDDFDLIDPAFYMNAVRTVLASTLALDAALPISEAPGG